MKTRNAKLRMRRLREERLRQGLCQLCGKKGRLFKMKSCSDCLEKKRFKYSQEKEDIIINILSHMRHTPQLIQNVIHRQFRKWTSKKELLELESFLNEHNS